MKTSPKLSSGLEEVDVVAADEVLGQVDDGRHQTLLQERETRPAIPNTTNPTLKILV